MILRLLALSILTIVTAGCGDATKEPEQIKPVQETKIECTASPANGIIDVNIGWRRCPPRPCDRNYPVPQPMPYPRPDYPPMPPPPNPWPNNDNDHWGNRGNVQVCTCQRPPYNHQYANYCEVWKAGIPNPSTGEVCWPNRRQ